MHPRFPLLIFCLSLALANLAGQTAETPAKPEKPAEKPSAKPAASRETPPDSKAYRSANAISDPQKKIAALEKAKADFPKSAMRDSADRTILSTLVHKFPEQSNKIRSQAKAMYKSAERNRKGAIANTIADTLRDAPPFLKDAESYARRAVSSMQQAKYVQDEKAGYVKRKQKVPSDDVLIKRFRENRGIYVATLGQVEVKMGHTARGQALLEEAHAARPDDAEIDSDLGELVAKAGNDSKALEYLVPARLSGRASATASAALETIYRKQHHGSLEGLDAMLDAAYRERYPNPIHVDPYQPGEKRSDRVVLAEVFTGAGCPPCVAADLSFDAVLGRYSRNDVVVVMYHQHIPRPDPLTNAQTIKRFSVYDGHGVPTWTIDGKVSTGGQERQYAKSIFDRIDPSIVKELESPAGARLKVDAAVSGNKVTITADVDTSKSDSADLKLQVLLLEKEVAYSGENGIRFHPMVVRAMGGKDGAGFPLEDAGKHSFKQSFDLEQVSVQLKRQLDEYEAGGHRGESFKFIEKKDQINRGELAVVAFVQDAETKEVLQSFYVDLGTTGGAGHITSEIR